jgi:hypothetical protein
MAKSPLTWILVLVLAVAGLFALALYGGGRETGGPELDAFAKCVADKGFVMYGAYWCSHCQNEKKQYGSSFKYIKYVECTKEAERCTAAGIAGFPTWISGAGEKFEGELGLDKMSEVSGCSLPRQ